MMGQIKRSASRKINFLSKIIENYRKLFTISFVLFHCYIFIYLYRALFVDRSSTTFIGEWKFNGCKELKIEH